MKATFNIKTRIFNVSGKDIYSLRVRIKVNECGDYWNSVRSKKTGEPLYDVNIWHDDFADDGGEWNNPKNWQAQFVDLIPDKESRGGLTTGSDWRPLPLKVKRK